MEPVAERRHPYLRCMAEEHPRATVIRVAGEVDLCTAEILQDAIDSALYHDRSIIMDVRELGYIDSTGLHILMRCHEALRRQGHRLALSSPARPVRRVMEIAGLWPMVSVYPDLRTALVAFVDG